MSSTRPDRRAARLRRPVSSVLQAVVPVLATALLLTACSAHGSGPVGAGTAAPAAAASGAASTPPSPPSARPPSGAPSGPRASSSARPSRPRPTSSGPARPAPVKTCAAEVLDVVLGPADSGAGSIDRTVVLSNRGRAACTISGAPTVRLLTSRVEQLGAPATGSGAPGPLVRLPSGGSASLVVRIVNVGDDGGPLSGRCTPAPAAQLVVDSDVYARYDALDGDFRGCTEPDVAYMSVTPWRLDG